MFQEGCEEGNFVDENYIMKTKSTTVFLRERKI